MLSEDSKYLLLYKLHIDSSKYISKFNFYSIVPWKDILNWLPKCEGCTQFCEILYVLWKVLYK